MSNSFQDGNGRWVTPPDRVEYRFGATRGTLIEVFSDGDARVRFDGEKHPEMVKWHHLCAVPKEVEEPQPSGSSEQGNGRHG